MKLSFSLRTIVPSWPRTLTTHTVAWPSLPFRSQLFPRRWTFPSLLAVGMHVWFLAGSLDSLLSALTTRRSTSSTLWLLMVSLLSTYIDIWMLFTLSFMLFNHSLTLLPRSSLRTLWPTPRILSSPAPFSSTTFPRTRAAESNSLFLIFGVSRTERASTLELTPGGKDTS